VDRTPELLGEIERLRVAPSGEHGASAIGHGARLGGCAPAGRDLAPHVLLGLDDTRIIDRIGWDRSASKSAGQRHVCPQRVPLADKDALQAAPEFARGHERSPHPSAKFGSMERVRDKEQQMQTH